MTREHRVLVHRDRAALASAVAARFITKVIDLLDEQDFVHVVLTGGGVGTAILSEIGASEARDSIDWARVHIWWGDERWVTAGHEDRNDAAAFTALLDHVALVPAHIHPFPARSNGANGDAGLDAAAEAHSRTLAEAASDGRMLPVFDITFLGVGPDGHIASLFPDTGSISDNSSTVLAVRDSPKPPSERLTLSLQAINTSDRIWLCLTGADKASALGLALAGASPEHVPVAGAYGQRRTVFFVDADAASEVPDNLISPEY